MKLTQRLKLGLRFIIKGNSPEGFFRTVVPAWQSGRPASWSADAAEQVRHYKHWVYSAVSAIAEAVASSKLALYAKAKGGEKKITDHPFLELLEHVNPFHTRFHLWSSTITFLELTGNAYWYVPLNGLGAPGEIWLLHSQNVRVIPSRKNYIDGYLYRVGADELRFSPEEIVHLRYPNPRNHFYGQGPLAAAAESVDTHEMLKGSQRASLKNGVMPSLALETDQPLSKDDIDRLQEEIRRRYGGTEQAGKVLLLYKGLTAKPISFSPREMMFLQMAKLTREEILGIFKVPAAIAGLSEDVNRASAETLEYIFAKYCVYPRLRLIEEELNQDLLPLYDRRLFCRFENPVTALTDAGGTD